MNRSQVMTFQTGTITAKITLISDTATDEKKLKSFDTATEELKFKKKE